MFPLLGKINLLWFVYKGWLLPAHTCLCNLSLQHPYCLLCFPSPSQKEIQILLRYFGSDEQLFDIALILQDDTNINIVRKFCIFFWFARKLCYCFLQTKVHRLFHLLHISRNNQTTSLLRLWLLWDSEKRGEFIL